MKKACTAGSRSSLLAKGGVSVRFQLVFLLILSGVGGCNFPDRPVTTLPVNGTSAFATVQLRLTQLTTTTPSRTPQVTLAPMATIQASPTASPTRTVPTRTPRPAPSATPTKPCDLAAAGNPIDVTIPDDTIMRPGQSFTKIWRLRNVGSCTWTEAYTVELFSGSAMSAPSRLRLEKVVPPNGSIEISVDLSAPFSAGKHQGNWKLRNATGKWFGIGPNGSAPFWVRIEVVAPPTDRPSETSTSEPAPSETPTSEPVPSETPTLEPAPSDTPTLEPVPSDTPTLEPAPSATLTSTIMINRAAPSTGTSTPGTVSGSSNALLLSPPDMLNMDHTAVQDLNWADFATWIHP